jgi:toxin ParE1/3/4
MKVVMRVRAKRDLEVAFDYYQAQRVGLGLELLDEFRRGIDRILELPVGWARIDRTYRRYRLNRFPYGIVYWESAPTQKIVVVAFMHMSQKPGNWK